MNRSDDEWREQLSPEQYRVLREKGTDPAYAGAYHDSKTPGTYVCAGCGEPLFASDTKFDSGTGWPSFYAPADSNAVAEERDTSHGMMRTEVQCNKCGGHLGHLFEDGPNPTGMRYCINSTSLGLKPDEPSE